MAVTIFESYPCAEIPGITLPKVVFFSCGLGVGRARHGRRQGKEGKGKERLPVISQGGAHGPPHHWESVWNIVRGAFNQAILVQ